MKKQILLASIAAMSAAFAQAPTAAAAAAPKPAAPDMSTPVASVRALQTQVAGVILKSAEKMPEENFAFKPTPDIRSFGQLLGHVADAQYMFCSRVIGEKVAPKNIEKTMTSKADLKKSLEEAFAYCEKAYSISDAAAAEPMNMMGSRAKIGVLSFNVAHNFEHYGNIVTYMRLKGLVPPSSEGR